MERDLGTGDVHIHYRVTDRTRPDAHTYAMHILSSDERDRAQRFVFPRDRITFVATHVLLRQALSAYEDVPSHAWTFAVNQYGKPMLGERHAATNLRFNLAHTAGLVACIICRARDVGIDVESLDRVIDALEIATRYFSPNEVMSLDACNHSERHTRFVELWTLKEAYVKAVGVGLSHPLHTFGFNLEDSLSCRFEPPVQSEQSRWQFALFAPTGRHRMAAAIGRLPGETLRITVSDGRLSDTATALRVSENPSVQY